ncbi:MAG: polyprenyl synthetase family protein [Mycoplasmatales bacterium]
MDKITEIKSALKYHEQIKSTRDILVGDQKIFQILQRGQPERVKSKAELRKHLEENIKLRDSICEYLDMRLQIEYEYMQIEQSEVDLIDTETMVFLNSMTNKFVRNNLLRLNAGTKKKLRALMYLTSKDTRNDADYKFAVVIELFHLTTLIQDDVIDRAKLRRFQPTINELFSNELAVLSSDYLLVTITSFYEQLTLDYFEKIDQKHLDLYDDVTKLFNLLIQEMLSSQMMERDVGTVADYYKYIDGKTAIFFAFSIKLGKLQEMIETDTYDENELAKYYEFGLEFGRLFQMIDDYSNIKKTAKQTGKDSIDLENQQANYVNFYKAEGISEEKIESMLQEKLENLKKLEKSTKYLKFIQLLEKEIKWRKL